MKEEKIKKDDKMKEIPPNRIYLVYDRDVKADVPFSVGFLKLIQDYIKKEIRKWSKLE